MCAEVQKLAAIVRIFDRGDFKGDALILFPDMPADYHGRYCQSWSPNDGHGGANYLAMMRETRPASQQEAEKHKSAYELQHNQRVPEDERLELVLCRRRTRAHRREFDRTLRDMA